MLPDNLSELGLAALQALATAIKAASAGLNVEENFDQLNSLSNEFDQVQARIDELSAAEADKNTAIDKINANLFSQKEDMPEEEALDEIEDDTEAQEPPVAEDDSEGSVEGAAMASDEAAADVVEEAAAEAPAEVITPDAVTPPAPEASASQRANAMKGHVPEGRKAAPAHADASGNGLIASRALANQLDAIDQGQSVDFAQIAKGMSKIRSGFGNISSYEEQVLATASINGDVLIGSDSAEQNYKIMLEAGKEARETALVASGAPCLAPSNDYSFFRLNEVHRPIEEKMPTLLAPEGAFRYVQPVDWAYLSGGVTVKTCADEAITPYVPKNVIEVDCPSYVECCVSSVAQIIQFNNLTHKAFPTFVEEALYHLGVSYAETKEIMYLDEIVAGSVNINAAAAGAIGGTTAYDAPRNVGARFIQNAAAYRKRHRMANDAMVQVIVPDLLENMNTASGLMDARLADVKGAFTQAMSDENIEVIWTYYLPSTAAAAEGTALYGAQADAADMNAWPTVINGLMFAPGTWVRMDSGTLDLGIVRDSVLNRNNDLHIFAEQWTKLCKVGYESDLIPVAVCPNGAGAGDVAPIDC